MGKPTNTKNNGCAVTTSNCVVWQGPDLCCINLCEGDSISEVIDALAKKICALFEILDPAVYDVSAFLSGACPPSKTRALVANSKAPDSSLGRAPRIPFMSVRRGTGGSQD